MNRPHRLARIEFGKAFWGQRPTPTHDKPQSPSPPGRSLAAGFLYLLFAYSAFLAAPPSHAATRYVNLVNPTPATPYTSWATAATNIQHAIDAAVAGDEILVTNGVYQTGATAVYGMSNRVAVTKPVTVQSVNGPEVTIIAGYRPIITNGPTAVRCVYLTNGAVLAGFTLTNGATQTSGGYRNEGGGGVWCESTNAVVTSCVLTGNSADYLGGGAYNGTLGDCVLAGNVALDRGGGAYSSTLNHCALTGNGASRGGGAYGGTLNHCSLTGNRAGSGGGAFYGTLNYCTLTSNSASYYGGGTGHSTLNNCTLTGNSANDGGGAYEGTLNNCIVYYNSVQGSGNNYDANFTTLNYCCTTPLPSRGTGNLTNAPLFTDTNGWSNLRLQANSPCINAGHNAYASGDTDLDGNPRIAGGQVDIGAYEFQTPGSVISYTWLQGYGLATDGSADDLDADRDGHNNWQEWQADTDPTNAGSVLRLVSIPAGPLGTVEFSPSSLNRRYTLLYATNLNAAPWTNVPGQTEVPGTGGWQTLRDTNAAPPRFYRVQVVHP